MGRHSKGRVIVGAGRAAGVAHDGGELCKKRLKAMDGGAILAVSTPDLRFRLRGALRWRYRIAGGLDHLIFIGEEQLAPGLLQNYIWGNFSLATTSVRRLSVCATGRPSLPRVLDLGATHDLFAPLRDAAAVLRANRALFWRTTGSPTITGRRVDVLAGGLRPPARTYASRGLRASASLSLARSVRRVMTAWNG